MASHTGRMSVSVSPEVQAKLDAIAEGLDRSRNWIVNQAISWQKEKIQARLNRANSEQATFHSSKDVDAVIDTFTP